MDEIIDSKRQANTVMIWQQVARIIKRSIQSGSLKPGDRVIEAQLAQQLGISRNPIREGLRQLQRQGIVEYRPNLGTVVATISKMDIRLAFDERISIEQKVVRMLMQKPDKFETFRVLSKVLSEMEAFPKDSNQLDIELVDEDFHKELVAASGSKVLLIFWKSVAPYTWMFPTVMSDHDRSLQPDIGLCYERHKWLLNELFTGDTTRAEAAVKIHLQEAITFEQTIED